MPITRMPVTKSEYNKKLFDVFLNMFVKLKESIQEWKSEGDDFLITSDSSNIIIAKNGGYYFAFRGKEKIHDWAEISEFSDVADKFSVFGDQKLFPSDDELNIISKLYKNEMRFVVDGRHEKVNKGSLENPDWRLEGLSKSLPIMVYRFGKADDFDEFLITLFRNNIVPVLKNTADKEFFEKIITILQKYPEFLKIQVKSLKFDQKIFGDYLAENTTFADSLKNSEYYSKTTSDDAYEMLLECDKNRAGLPEHSPEELTGANQGHWDLYADEKDIAEYIEINKEEQLIPRNPKDDVKLSGTVGIDFGTKSTVVVGWPGQGRPMPISISSENDISKKYENPTVMQFVNIERFLNDYDSKKGRPNTKWEDLKVSHVAVEQFNAINNEQAPLNDSFLYQIKQWAGDLNRKQLIKDDHEIYELKSFLDIDEEDLNPIEIYAYYIGLYINRMNNNVYLNYYLAFPVTYDAAVRDKIVKSFETGLRKSLPEAILNDENLMKRFKVHGQICEPTAYAATALTEYGFEPKEHEKVRYAVFDFGGGTSDFDYGTWEKSESEKYSYRLDNFTKRACGVKTLGGENLLEDLAFKIFKDNRNLLSKDDQEYHFCFGSTQERFLGWEDVIGTKPSRFARKNMHNLVEVLRPYWEKSNDYIDIEADVKKKLEDMANPDLHVDEEDLFEVISQIRGLLEKYKSSFNGEEEFKNAETELKQIERTLNQKENEDSSRGILDRLSPRRPEKITATRNNLQNFFGDYLRDKIDFNDNADVTELIKFSAWSESGNQDRGFEFNNIRKCEIFKFFEDKIRSGVKSFVMGLKDAFEFDNKDSSEKVNIFLAGNSCKSPIFRRVLKEEIKNFFETEIQPNEGTTLFEIFPPLGSEEAKRKMRARGMNPSDDGPNGKTGVAYGLIKCGAGGEVRTNRLSRSEYLPWYIGKMRNGKFLCIGDETHKCKINVWYKVRKVECDEDELDTVRIGYTRNIGCTQNTLNEDHPEISWQSCESNSDGSTFFVKAVDDHTIVCVVANTDDPDDVDSNKIDGSETVIPIRNGN